jgi:pyruvate/2-oxoglutarate dehydrogenase complex dihydrolipoamide dehydrogenase (E3) component
MTEPVTVDVVVLGMGPGGEEVAGRLAEAGLSVIGVDRRLLGGECPYWGCIPSKMMIRAANSLAESRRVPELAGRSSTTADWSLVAHRIRSEATDDWDDTVAVKRFESKGGRFVRGDGRLIGPREVAVADMVIEARRAIVIGTGTEPSIPPIPGLAGLPYWTNHEAIETETLPSSLLVVGGGAIGLELAQVFARFGTQVTVVEAADRLLCLEEPEASEVVAGVFEYEGIAVCTAATISAATAGADGLSLDLAYGSESTTTLTAEKILVATGRHTDLEGIGAGVLGIGAGERWLPVDDHLRVAPGVWAVGDVTGKGAFTHVSMYQANIVVDDILGKNPVGADYAALPRVTFTDPEVGAVGQTEDQAKNAGVRVRTGFASLPSSSRGWIHKAGNEGFIKIVEDAERGVLVGATSVGPTGGEVLGLLALAVHARVPVDELRRMIFAYPTFHRAIEAALVDLLRT